MEKFKNVIRFCETAPEFSVAMQDYFNNVQATERKVEGLQFAAERSLKEKETAINKLFCDELGKRSGMPVPTDIDDARRYSTNQTVLYFANEIIDNTIDMILPDSLISSLGYIADIRFGGYLDSFSFDLENNALFSVNKSGRRQRNVPAQVLEDTTVTLAPQNREVTVKMTLPEILVSRKSIATYLMKVMRSIEARMFYDVYDGFAATMDAVSATALTASSYTENTLISMCETVGAWNQGRKAVVLGTPVALKSVLPSSTDMRILLNDDYVRVGYLRNFNGYDVIMTPQVADYTSTAYGLKLKDNRLYVVSPASDKIVKVAVGGQTLSNTSGAYDKANLSMFGTVTKSWDVATATNSVAGVIKLA